MSKKKREEFNSSDYEYLRKEGCPKCGSSDNVAVWKHIATGKETKYCYTDGCDYRVTTASLFKSSQPGSPLPASWLQVKGLDADTAKRYRITKEDKVVYFGFANDKGKVIGIAGRNYGVPKSDDKHFFWKHKTNLLYGMDTCTTYDNLILVSGFWDAPSAFLMTGWSAVSLPNGDKSAKVAITENFQWLRKFKQIYICFDNDASGQSAAQTALELLGYRAKNVLLPDYDLLLENETVTAKDASDYLKFSLQREFLAAIKTAANSINPYIFGTEADELYAQYKQRGEDNGWSTGIIELDNLCKLRPNEFTLFFGAPGRGKSSFARHLISAVSNCGVRPFYISLEDPVWIAIDNLIRCLLRESTPFDANGKCLLTKEELTVRARRVRELVSIARLEPCNPEILADAIECAYVTYGCQFIVIDHITWLLNMEDDARQAAVEYINIIADLCKRLPIHVFVVSHNKPLDLSVQKQYGKKFQPDWEEYLDPTPRDAQWSSVFEQTAWNIWGWKKPSDLAAPAKLHVLKNRTGGMKKLGVVLCYFDEQFHNYMGVTQYAKQVQGNQRGVSDRRDEVRVPLSTREDDIGDLRPVDNEKPQEISDLSSQDRATNEAHSPSGSSTTDNEGIYSNSGDNTGNSNVDRQVHTETMESRLCDESGVHNRVQGVDGGHLSTYRGDFHGAASRLVQEIQNCLSETGFESTTKKIYLPGVGRTTRNRMDVLRPNKISESWVDSRLLAEIKFDIAQQSGWGDILR